ncbi:YcaO-like family protein [Spirilliplanes yamanashiensis]|nr:YcaO-like family protein [Spirilliplanes yamanashiensis]MDP9820001.1 ribosomal protein S12 methylthiotransferase accessory factor [Spirilliplanes yamanashiensis]
MTDATRAPRPPSTLDRLVSPVGVVGGLRRATAPRGLDRLGVWVGSAGSGRPGHAGHRQPELGSARVLDDPDLARVVAVAETTERYAGRNLAHRPVTARAADLPGAVLDMGRVARCSAREHAHPRCPLTPYDPDAPIRWVPGTDLHTGARVHVPAVMASYGVRPGPGERFWYQISTGTAVHTDPIRALTGALLEVIERDLIAVLWLQRLPVPALHPRHHTERVAHLLDRAARRWLTTHLFDATGDLGVPTVYALQTAPHDPRAHRVVGCGTGPDLGAAAESALLEMATLREAFHADERAPERPEDFRSVMHGAMHMADPARAAAFDFLLTPRPAADHDPRLPADPAELLRHLLGLLRERDMPAVVVDHTSRELVAAGLTGLTVVVPDLMPMSLHPLARYLAHPRLYDAPRRMGHRVLPEAEVNPWPQPFA